MRKLSLLFALLTCAVSVYPQGVRKDDMAQVNVQGFAKVIPGALITVCPLGSSGIPCTPANVPIFSNVALTTPLANPFHADGNGNYGWFSVPGTFTYTISGAGVVGRSFTVTMPCAPNIACPGVGTLTLFSSGNLLPLFTTSVANPTSTPGLSFAFVTAPAFSYFGNNTAAPALPTYGTISCVGVPTAICGMGSTNILPKFTGLQTIGNSLWTDNGSTTTYGGLIVSAPEYDATGVGAGIDKFFNAAGTFYVGLTVNNPLATYTVKLPDAIAAAPNDTFLVDTIVGPIVQLKWGPGGGAGSTIFPFDLCSPAQVVNQGNSFWSVANLTNWDAGHWEFVLNTAADLYCSIRLPDTVTTTSAHVILEMAANDSTAGHTVAIQTCDNKITTGTINVGALTCAANQNFTTTATAYQRATLTYVVQASVAAGNIIIVKIHQTQSSSVAANVFMWPYVQINQ